MDKIIFLDLEDTVIDTWDSMLLLPSACERIMKMINDANFKPEAFGIFSFAIRDRADIDKFDKELRSRLEKIIGWTFDDQFIWSTDYMKDIIATNLRLNRSKFSDNDFFDFFKKDSAFIECAKFHSNKDMWLFDDAVTPTHVEFPVQNVKVKITRI